MVTLEHTSADACILRHVRQLAALMHSNVILIHVADGFAARNQSSLQLRESEEMRDDMAYLEECRQQFEADGSYRWSGL